MDYKNKYLKYKTKYVELKNMVGGFNKKQPFLLYIIGQEVLNNEAQRSYLCTFLHQIDFIKRSCNISNNRIQLIYGKNGSQEVLHTCKHTKAGTFADKPIPYGINVTYINDDINLQQTIANILQVNIEPTTPVIFIYDGHGYTNPTTDNEEGDMVLYDNICITKNIMYNIFKPYDTNKKLFIFTQCGSYGFYKNLTSIPNNLSNSVYICSTNGLGQCGIGARVLVKMSELLTNNPTKYLTFRELGADLARVNYYCEDASQINISDILLTHFTALLKTNNDIHIGYNFSLEPHKALVQTISAGPDEHIWGIEMIASNIVRIKTQKQYQNEYKYIDIYDTAEFMGLYLWKNKLSSNNQLFIINSDNTISPTYNPKMCLAYNNQTKQFIHQTKANVSPENLIKLHKI